MQSKKNIVCIAEFPLFELLTLIIMRRKNMKTYKSDAAVRKFRSRLVCVKSTAAAAIRGKQIKRFFKINEMHVKAYNSI